MSIDIDDITISNSDSKSTDVVDDNNTEDNAELNYCVRYVSIHEFIMEACRRGIEKDPNYPPSEW